MMTVSGSPKHQHWQQHDWSPITGVATVEKMSNICHFPLYSIRVLITGNQKDPLRPPSCVWWYLSLLDRMSFSSSYEFHLT